MTECGLGLVSMIGYLDFALTLYSFATKIKRAFVNLSKDGHNMV